MRIESRGLLFGRYAIPGWIALTVIGALLLGKYWQETRKAGVLRYTVAEANAAPRLGWGTGKQSQHFRAARGQRIVLDYRADIRREHILISVDRMERKRVALKWRRRAQTLQYWNIRQSGAGQLVVVAPADDLYRVNISAVLMAFAGDIELKWRVE